MCEVTGAPHAVAFNSCTSALHAALHAMGCTPGTRLAVPALTFVGTITGARHIGADFRYTEVHPDTLTLTKPQSDVDLVVGVDLHGVPHDLARDRVAGAPVLTDACQSLGTRIDGEHIGARGVHAWSFSSAKLVTAPDGGAITTDDDEIAGRLRELRDYGVARDQFRSNGVVLWPGGHNWRPSELSMVMVAQRLEALDEWVARSREVAERLHATLDSLGLWRQQEPEGAETAWHKVRFGPADWDPDQARALESALAEAGVPTHRWGSVPLHRHEAFRSGQDPELPMVDAAAEGTLCLGTEACPPMTWNDDETESVCRILERIREGYHSE